MTVSKQKDAVQKLNLVKLTFAVKKFVNCSNPSKIHKVLKNYVAADRAKELQLLKFLDNLSEQNKGKISLKKFEKDLKKFKPFSLESVMPENILMAEGCRSTHGWENRKGGR